MAKEIRGIADLSLKKKKTPPQQNADDGFVLPLPQQETPAGALSAYAGKKYLGRTKELGDGGEQVLKWHAHGKMDAKHLLRCCRSQCKI